MTPAGSLLPFTEVTLAVPSLVFAGLVVQLTLAFFRLCGWMIWVKDSLWYLALPNHNDVVVM